MKKHKLLAVLLALAMTLTFLPTAALAEETETTWPNAENGVITLMEDMDISSTGWTVSGSVTLDLNGHSLKAANTSAGHIVVTGSLTLMDSSADNETGVGTGKLYTETDYTNSTTGYGIIEVSGGSFTMESGYIYAERSNAASQGQFGLTITGNNSGSITINGGKIEAGWYAISGNGTYQGSSATITINGGTLVSTADYALYLPHSGTTTITGGVVDGAAGGIAQRSGTLNIAGGKIASRGIGNTGDWSDGTSGMGNAAVNIGDNNKGLYGDCTVNITDGDFTAAKGAVTIATGTAGTHTATVSITGGTFSDDPTAYLTNGFSATESSGTWTVSAPVAQIGDVKYGTLQAALNAAAAGTGNVTVEILDNIDLTKVDWEPVTVSGPTYPMVTVNGNNKSITGLNDMLFAGTWAGNSGLIINDLTIKDSYIANDVDDKGNVGVGAFIGFPQASATVTLNNCHLVNSTVKGGHWTGGLIGYAAGYAGTDGPVFMNLTITGCSVTGSTITGEGSAGGVIGHGSGDGWTSVVIENTTVTGNTIASTGDSNVKAGSIVGTIGAAGQPTTTNGETKTGGMFVSATVSDNTVTSNGAAITTIYGRQGTDTGVLTLTGGVYDKFPIEQDVSYAIVAEGKVIVPGHEEDGDVYYVGTHCDYTIDPANGGELFKTSYASGYVVKSAVTPERPGYTFNGWKDQDGNSVTFPYTITKTVTITAQWTYTGGGSSGSGGGSSSSSSTSTTTEKNADGSTTTTVTDKKTGTVTETTKNTDGSTTTVETKKDGTVTETVKTAEGVTGTVVTDKNGDVTEVKSTVSSTAAKEAAKTGEAVTLPVEVPAAKTTEEAPALQVTVPKSADSVKVEIPVEKVTPGTVAVIVNADGTEKIVSTSVVTENGVVLTLDGNATVKIIDNSKSFTDVPADSVFYNEISSLSAREIMVGKTDDKFDLHSSVTLDQIANVAGRITGAVDVKDFNAGVSWGADNGLKTGGVAATRGDVLKALYIAAGSPAVEDTSILSIFNDSSAIPADMAAIAAWAAQNGILKGGLDGNANLGVNVTRGQACALAGRTMGTLD